MSSWLSRSLIVLAAFALCWLGAIAWWRESNHMPGTGDVVMFFLVLPLLLLLVLWVAPKLLAAAGAAAAASTGAAAAPAAADAAPAPQATPLVALAGSLRMPHGASPVQLATALASRKASLALDPELTNDRGYPILSGRIDDVDPLAQQDAMADWIAAHHPQADFSDEQWRALALGSEVVAEVAMELGPHPALPVWLDARDAQRTLPPLPALQLVALLPPDWREAERAAATAWLRGVVGAQSWPAARVNVAQPGADGAALAYVGQLAAQARSDEQPFLCLLLACGSRIGEATVDAWSRQHMLFDSDHPDGRIPGEGAAGLLLADQAQATLFDTDGAVLVHAPANARRAASIDYKPRQEPALLAQLATQALADAGVDPGAVAIVTADGDARAPRMTELFGATSATLPELDPASDLLAVGAACGDAGAVTTLAALVLARQHVSNGAGPALSISNLDPFHRSATLLTPLVAAPAAAASSSL